jgi:hypothetical protein
MYTMKERYRMLEDTSICADTASYAIDDQVDGGIQSTSLEVEDKLVNRRPGAAELSTARVRNLARCLQPHQP